MVVTVHFWAHARPNSHGFPVVVRGWDITHLFANAQDGVKIFFVLSGFLLYSSWLNGGSEGFLPEYFIRVRHFAVRRVRRIIPAFAFFLVLYVLLSMAKWKSPPVAN